MSCTEVGDKEVEISCQLDGHLQGFGKRFWKHMAEEAPELKRLVFDSDSDVIKIDYHDRYLFTPLAVALLVNLIEGLRDSITHSRWANVEVEVTTSDTSSNTRNHSRMVWDNWPDLTARDASIQQAFEYCGINVSVIPVDKFTSLHGRVLTIEFSSGDVLTIRLDQGVSYWRASTNRNRNSYFDFQERDYYIQGERVAKLAIDIVSSPFPTHIFIKSR